MIVSRCTHKTTRRGKLLKVLQEHYLRDDIPCRAPACTQCAGIDAGGELEDAAAGTSISATSVQLSGEPLLNRYLIIGPDVALHQIDMLESGAAVLTDVVVLQTVLNEVRARHLRTYGRLQALMREPSRRMVPFANEHHRETFTAKQKAESSADHARRAVTTAAAWLQAHYASIGVEVLLLTDDRVTADAADALGVPVSTCMALAEAVADVAPGLRDIVSSSVADALALGGDGTGEDDASTISGGEAGMRLSSAAAFAAAGAGGGAGEDGMGLEVVAEATDAAAAAAAAASGGSAPLAPLVSGVSLKRKRQGLYPEHWPTRRVDAGMRSGACFRGTLRVSRECFLEARVSIRGVSGRSDTEGRRATGGDDVVSILLLGRQAMNRAFDGDIVAIELLPASQWLVPSRRLTAAGASGAAPTATAAGTGSAEDAEEARILSESQAAAEEVRAKGTGASGGGGGGGGAASAGAGASSSAAAPHLVALAHLREYMKTAAAASASGGAGVAAQTGPVPTGRVVAVIRRNWRQYCGTVETTMAAPAAAAAAAPTSAASASAGAAAASSSIAAAAGAAATPATGAVVAASSAAARATGVAAGGSGSGTGGSPDGGAASVAAVVVPVDPRVPRIMIATRQLSSLLDKRLVVAVDSWPATSRYPLGHYVRTLGAVGDRRAETDVILLEHDIPSRPFSADVIACLPPADWSITPDNSAGRTDLRDLECLCSIDPPGCKDIDDALHARWVPGDATGRVDCGVHIADVSYFVKEGTAIDIEASLRANTTYLVERRLDMLPGLLTETLCSLKGGEDRFAFTVTWVYRPASESTRAAAAAVAAAAASGATEASAFLTGTGRGGAGIVGDDSWEVEPGSVRFFKSMIHSRAAMTYAQAQALLDDDGSKSGAAGSGVFSPVGQGVKLLASIARSMKASRKAAGALSLASTEVKVTLDSVSYEPLEVQAYELRETNSTVEEWMLAANCAVGQRTLEAYPRYSLLRRHPAPPRRQFDALLAAAASVGVSLDVTSGKALADSLDAALVEGNPHFNKLLRILTTRCMMQANYFSSGEFTPPEYAHYGLASPVYTHFTSPIRRYADVIVHRLLAAALDIEPLPRAYEDRASMRAVCANMNRRHLASQLAGRASSALHTNAFFRHRVVVESGLVMKLAANGAVVLVPRFGLEGTILLGTSAASGSANVTPAGRTLVYDEATQTLTAGPAAVAAGGASSSSASVDASPLSLRVFDEVRVAVYVARTGPRGRQELQFRIIDPPFCTLAETVASVDAAPGVKVTVDDRTTGKKLARNTLGALAAAGSAAAGAPPSSVATPAAPVAGGSAGASATGGVKRKRPVDAAAASTSSDDAEGGDGSKRSAAATPSGKGKPGGKRARLQE